jgi:threonine dehydratase
MRVNWVEDIIAAHDRIKDRVINTPVMTSTSINEKFQSNFYFKCENFQKMGAFKFRGAYNTLLQIPDDLRAHGVITHSSGNHAQALALAGKYTNTKTIIVMPKNAPKIKYNATEDYGAEIIQCEPTILAREELCNQLIEEHDYVLVHPYDNINVIKGAGTACLELLNQVEDVEIVMAPVGGGGLLSGTSAYAKESGKVNFIFGAEPTGAADAYESMKSGKIQPMINPQTIADGLRTQLSELTFSVISEFVDAILTVSEKEIIDSMKLMWERMKIIVEPSGAVALAAAIKGIRQNFIPKNTKIGIIISGGNVDLDEYFTNLYSSISSLKI